jgi:UDP-glucose 4-epimerase
MAKKYKYTTLVTGGSGFIGSHLVGKLIKLDHRVIVIDNLSTGRIENIKNYLNKIIFIKKSITDIAAIQKYFYKVDFVFHLAALADIVPSINFPRDYFNANVLGTLNVLELSKKNKVKKFIYTASSSCYGLPKKFPTDEKEKIDIRYPYALTKKNGEDLVLHWGKIYNLNVVSFRLFNVYGTRSRTSGTYGAMFGTFLKQKIQNHPFTVVGNGQQKRDFTYVTDVVDALIRGMKYKKKNQVFNVGSGKSTSINYICNLLKGKKIFIPKRPGEPHVTFANIKKIKKELNWRAKINIEKGVKLLLDDISYWKKAPLWTPKKIKIATKDWFKFLSD